MSTRMKKIHRHRLLKVFRKFRMQFIFPQYSTTASIIPRFTKPSISKRRMTQKVDFRQKEKMSATGFGDSEGGDENLNETLYFEKGRLLVKGKGNEAGLTEWVKISDTLVFNKDGDYYYAKIRMKNECSSSYITYLVIPTNPEGFGVSHEVGLIAPNDSAEVMVMLKQKIGQTYDFWKLSRDSGFVIYTTPVFFNSQLNERKLKVLWKEFGSQKFPEKVAEKICIHRLIPGQEDWIASNNDNVLDNMSAWACMHLSKPLPYDLANKFDDLATTTNSSEFLTSWTPGENDSRKNIRYQLGQLVQCMASFKDDVLRQSFFMKTSLSTLILIGVTSFAANFPQAFQAMDPQGFEFLRKPEPEVGWFGKFFK